MSTDFRTKIAIRPFKRPHDHMALWRAALPYGNLTASATSHMTMLPFRGPYAYASHWKWHMVSCLCKGTYGPLTASWTITCPHEQAWVFTFRTYFGCLYYWLVLSRALNSYVSIFRLNVLCGLYKDKGCALPIFAWHVRHLSWNCIDSFVHVPYVALRFLHISLVLPVLFP